MSTAVLLSRDGAYARIRLASFAGPEIFGRFRSAIEGARYDREKRVNLVPIDKVPNILNRLRDAGFEARYEGGSDLHDVLLERTAQQWLDLKSVQDRIERIDREIYEKTSQRLFPYQKTGSQWLTLRYGALLADDPGLGKTLQVIVSLPPNAPVLVVGPAAAKGVWVGEVERWRSQIPVRMLSGRDSFRWPKPGTMLVTNYDILPDIHDTDGSLTGRACSGMLAPPPPEPCKGCKEDLIFRNGKMSTILSGHEPSCTGFLPAPEPERCMGCHPFLKEAYPDTVVVADEAHALKNGQARRTQRFRAISRAVRERGGRCWLVTGTPMENEPTELWGVLDAAGLAQEAFGSYKNFVSLFKGKPRMFGAQRSGYDWGSPEPEVGERLQRVSLRRRAEDVLPELPDLIWGENVVDVDLDAVRECDSFVERSGGMGEIARLLSQEKIPFEKMSRILTVLAVAKYKAALEIVKEHEKRGEPLLVFSMHREPIDMLAKRKGWLTITGDVPAEKRKEIQDRFQDPKEKIKGIACTIPAAGVALTLHRAAHEIFIDRSWNPKMNEQAAKRAHRIGQKRTVYATVIRANHVLDRRLQETLNKKSQLFVASVDAAAVTDDAPPCAEQDFDGMVRRTQEEISLGRVVRRMADTDEQRETLERIHTVVFARASDERIARQLGEEAAAVGLSEAQWRLAASVAARGRRPEIEPEPAFVETSEKTNTRRRKSVAESKDDATRLSQPEERVDMAKIDETFKLIADLSDDERDVLFDLLGAEKPVDVQKIQSLAGKVAAFKPEERDILLGKLDEAGFLSSDDEDDDDEEEDDGDDGDDEDDGEDEGEGT